MGGSQSEEVPVDWKAEHKAKFVWRAAAFAGEFGDPFIKDTSLEGGTSAPAIDLLVEAFRHVLNTQRRNFARLSPEQESRVDSLCAQLVEAAELDRLLGTRPAHDSFATFLDTFMLRVKALRIGQRLVLTGGWRHMKGGHAIMYVIEHISEDEWSLAIANTGNGVKYHPHKPRYPKTLYRTVIRLGGIPTAKITSADFWTFVHKIRAFPQANHGPEVLYEIALPHLCDGYLPREYLDDDVGDFETAQRAGTCYYRCILSMSKYLLKRDGFDIAARKRLFMAVRVAFLDMVRRDMEKVSASEFFDSDRRIIQMALEQTAHAAVKELNSGHCVDKAPFEKLRDELEELRAIADAKVGEEEDVMNGVDLGEVAGSPVAPFIGLELLADDNDTDLLVGGAMEGTPSLAVDLLCPVVKVESFDRALLCISFCCGRTLQLFKKRGACATSLVMHQVCSLVEHVFTCLLPMPLASSTGCSSCIYANASATREQYLECLGSLRQILAGYVAASHSRTANAGTDSSRAVTATAIIAIVDAVVRLKPKDQKSSLAEVLAKASGDEQHLSATRFNGDPVSLVLERVMCCAPGELRARDGALRYFERCSGVLFGWPMSETIKGDKGTNIEVSDEDDPTLHLVGRLVQDLALPDLPPEHAASEGRLLAWSRAAWQTDLQEITLLQRCGRWCAHSWEELPEFAEFRDAHFLFRVALEATDALRSLNSWLPPTWGPAESVPRWIAFRDSGASVQFRVMTVNFDQEFLGLGRNPASAADLTRLIPGQAVHSEEDILFAENLPSFGELLSVEEAERLMTYLTAPHMAVPLVMQFFAQGRIGCLVKPELRRMLDAVVFEAKEYAAEPKKVDVIPVWNDDRRSCLGTRWGMLLQEVSHSPVSVLRPLVQMMRSAITLCLGDFRSSFVPVMLYMVRLAYRVVVFLRHIDEQENSCLPRGPSEKPEAIELLADVRRQLNLAAEQLRSWLTQSEAADEVQVSTNLCAHLALLVDVEAGKFSAERWDRLVSTVAFVVSWHSKGAASRTTGGRLHRRPPPSHFGGAGRRRRGEAEEQEAHLAEVPVAECFAVLERRRAELLHWLSTKPEELDAVLSHVAGAALNREVSMHSAEVGQVMSHGWRGWQAVDDKPLMCEVMLESPHPYRPSTDEYCHVRFPGAAYISIHFDDQCSTEKDHDFVTIYKDATFTRTWGPCAELSGMGESTGNWPGVAGRPPLVVAADEFWLYFHSDASQESWGWKLLAFAPVNKEAAFRLADTLSLPPADDATGDAAEVPAAVKLRAAQKGLTACRNDLGPEERAWPLRPGQVSAEDYLAANRDRLLQEARDELADAPQLKSSGIFQDPTGSVEVSLQTCEVYLQQRMLMPTPSAVADHPDFLEALDLKGKDEIPFCAVRDRMANRMRVTLLHKDRTYEICRWSPLIPRSNASLTETERPVCGGLLDLPCYGFPRQEGDFLQYGGKSFKMWDYNKPLEEDVESWVLKCFSSVLLEAVNEAGLDELPVLWRANAPEAGEGSLLEEHLLMHVPASGSLEERKGHPGALFEVMALKDRRSILVFALREEARRVQRSLAWSSDSGIALADLEPEVGERYSPWVAGTRYAAGNMFAMLMSKKGELLSHPYLQAGEDNPSHGTLCIRRANVGASSAQRLYDSLQAKDAEDWGEPAPKAATAEEWASEVFIPHRCLQGVLPAALLEQYSFWRTSPLAIRGYPKAARTESELLVRLCRSDRRRGPESCVAMVQRLHVPPDGCLDHEALKTRSCRPATLLNPQLAQRGSPLWQISEALKRFESAGWVLYWSDAVAHLGEEVACTLVELPRLRLRFEVREGRLYSLEYDGLRLCKSVPAEVKQLCRGLPHALALENPVLGSLFVLIPNYEPKVLSIHVCPLNTELILMRSEGFMQYPATRYYLYPVHTSGKFLQAPSVPSAFYLLLLRLLRRDYIGATRILESCFSDVPFNAEERWLMGLLSATQTDMHPNAVACRLRLALLWSELPGEKHFKVSDDLDLYTQSFAHVSQQCRLTLEEELLLMNRFGIRNARRRYDKILEVARKGNTEAACFTQSGEEAAIAGMAVTQAVNGASSGLRKHAEVGKFGSSFKVKMINGLRYKQPQIWRQSAANGLQLMLDLCQDDVNGSRHQLGFGLLNDMLIGRVNFDWAPTLTAQTEAAESEVEGPSREATFKAMLKQVARCQYRSSSEASSDSDGWKTFDQAVLSKIQDAYAAGDEKVEIDLEGKKHVLTFASEEGKQSILQPCDEAEDQAAEEGKSEKASCLEVKIEEDSDDKFQKAVKEALPSMAAPRRKASNAELAGLLAQEMLLNPKITGNKEALLLVAGVARASCNGEQGVVEQMPFWPSGDEYAKELDKGIGSNRQEATPAFKFFEHAMHHVAGKLLEAKAWTSLTTRSAARAEAPDFECRPTMWEEPVKLRDCHLGSRVLSPMSLGMLEFTDQDVTDFSTAPLARVAEVAVRHEKPLQNSTLAALPFDLRNLPSAGHEMAQAMLKRLAQDVEEAREHALTATVPQLSCLDSEAMRTIRSSGEACREALSQALSKVRTLEEDLQALLQTECASVTAGVKITEETANSVNEAADGAVAFQLARFAASRSRLSFEALAAAVVCSQADEDLCRINPFLHNATWDDILKAVCTVLLRSVRVTQLRACLSAADALKKDITAFLHSLHVPSHSIYASGPMVKHAIHTGDFDPTRVQQTIEPLCAAVEELATSVEGEKISKQKAIAAAQLCLEVEGWDIQKARSKLMANPTAAGELLQRARRRCTDENGRALPSPSPHSHSEIASERKEHSALEHALVHSSQHVADQVAAMRHYMRVMDASAEVTYDCRFLIFEYMVGFMLRRRQVELIRDFAADATSGKSSVHQMIMGQGKTTVISPMLALLLADGKRLVTQVVPAELHEMSCSVLRACFQNIVKKRIYTLYFDRSSQSSNSLDSVAWLHAKMHSARQQSAVVCTSPGSVKSLLLKYVELLHVVSGAPEPLRCPLKELGQMKSKAEQMAGDLRTKAQVADELAEVIRLWGPKGGGIALLDEVDLLTHPLKSELNYPIGPKMLLDGHEFRWDLPIFLLDGLFRVVTGELSVDVRPTASIEAIVNEITAAVKDGEVQQKLILRQDVEICLLQPAYYGERFRDPMARWALVWLKEQPVIEAAVQSLCQASRSGAASEGELSEAEAWKAFESYIADRTKPEDFARFSVAASAMRMLNLAREWCTGFMPYVLSKVDRVSYGLLHPADLERWEELEGKPPEMPQSRLLLAVPFVGKDVPARNAEFAHPEVLIGLSILAYRYEGLRVQDMKKVISSLQAEMQYQPGPFVDRPSRVLFQDWLGSAARSRMRSHQRHDDGSKGAQVLDDDLEVLPLELLKVEDADQFATAYAALRSHPPTVYYYLQKLVFPAVLRHQDQKLTASGVDLAGDMLFNVRLGFSGTPSDLLPPSLRPCHFEPGSEAEMLRVLTDPETVDHEVVPPAWTVESLLQRVATGKSRGGTGYAALIDCGALVTGFTNEEVARKLLEIGLEGMDAVVYLDASDAKMVVDRAGSRPVPLSRSGVRKERRFTFYDQVHTTGMDIKQGFDSCAVVTLGKDMTWRDYAQGCYRMRGLGKGQTLHLTLVSEIAELIHAASNTGNILVDVVAWLIGNSMNSEQLQSLALTGQCLSDTWRKQALAALLPTKAPLQRPGYPLTSRFWRHIDPHFVAATLARTTLLTQEEINALEIKRLGDRTQAALGQLKLILGTGAVADLQRTYKYLMESMSRDELVRARLFHEKLLAFAEESGIAIDLPPEGSDVSQREAAEAKRRKAAAKKDLEMGQEQVAAVVGNEAVEEVLAPLRKKIKSISKAATVKHNGEGLRKGWTLRIQALDAGFPASKEERMEADPANWNWSLKFRFQVTITGLEGGVDPVLVEAYPGLWNEELLLESSSVHGSLVIDTENLDGGRSFQSSHVQGKLVFVSLTLTPEELKNRQEHVKSADRALRHATAAGALGVVFGCTDAMTSEAFGLDMTKISALVVRKPYPKVPAFVLRAAIGTQVKEVLTSNGDLEFTGGTRLKNPSLLTAELVAYKLPAAMDGEDEAQQEGATAKPEQVGLEKGEPSPPTFAALKSGVEQVQAATGVDARKAMQLLKDADYDPVAATGDGPDSRASSISSSSGSVTLPGAASKPEVTAEKQSDKEAVAQGQKDNLGIRGRALIAPMATSPLTAYQAAAENGAQVLILVADGPDLFIEQEAQLPGHVDTTAKVAPWKMIRDQVISGSPTIPAFQVPRIAGEELLQRLAAGERLKMTTSFAVPQVEEEVELLSEFTAWASEAGFAVDCPNTRQLKEQPEGEDASCIAVRMSVLEEDGTRFTQTAAEEALKSYQAFMSTTREKEYQRLYSAQGSQYPPDEARDRAWKKLRLIGAGHAVRVTWAKAAEASMVPIQTDMLPADFATVVQEALVGAVRTLSVTAGAMHVGEMQNMVGVSAVPAGSYSSFPHQSGGTPTLSLTLIVQSPSQSQPDKRSESVLRSADGRVLQVLEGNQPLEQFGLSKEACAKGEVEVLVLVGATLTQADLEAVLLLDSGELASDGEKQWEERAPKYQEVSLADFVTGMMGRNNVSAEDASTEATREAATSEDPEFLHSSVEVFVEGLSLHLASQPPIPRPYYEILEETMAQRSEFLSKSAEGLAAAQAIIDSVKQSSQSSSGGCDCDELNRGMEVVQEQQKEEQKEKEKQKEREIQRDYARNPADSVRWAVDGLNSACTLLGTHFYPSGALKTRVRRRVAQSEEEAGENAPSDVVLSSFPEQFLLSENFAPFMLHSDLPRRLKNVEVIMCWTPSDISNTYGAEEDDPGLLKDFMALTRETLSTLAARCPSQATGPHLAVCVSLAEAETLRRCLTARAVAGSDKDASAGLPPSTVVSLVLASTGLQLSPACEEDNAGGDSGQLASTEAPFRIPGVAVEDLRLCARFFDAQMWYSEDEVIQILRSLAKSAPSQRRVSFEALIACKRRDRYSWEATPVAQVFHHADERTLQHLRGLLSRVRDELTRRKLSPAQAFALWDLNADGWLSQSDLGTALKALGLGLSDGDIAELLQHADVDGDGFLDYREFTAEFGISLDADGEAVPLRRRRRHARADMSAEKQSILRQLQDLSGSPAGEETASSAAPLPHGMALDGNLTNWRGLAALGSMHLTSGGHVQFHGDGRVSTQPGYRPSIKPRGVNLTSGCWYWELTVSVVGRASVGWATPDFHGDSAMAMGVGDDEHSWGFDGYTQQLYGWNKKTPYGFYWGPGDVIGIALDAAKGEMQWSLNGSFAAPMGKASERIPSSVTVTGLAPAVSFDSAFQFLVNLGQSPFRHRPPEGYRSVWSWVSGVQERQHAILAGARFAKFQCTSGQAGVGIKEDLLTFTQGFPSVTLAGCLLTRGKWYYEFENVSPSRCPQIGWADLDFIGASRSGVGVGDDKHSWGYDGGRAPRQGLWADGYVNYGEHWNTGDIAGAAADLEGQRLSFSLNGSWERPMGVAVESVQHIVGITPAVTAQAYCVVRVNLGERPFKYSPPPGHRGVYEWIQGMRSVLSLQRTSLTPLPPPMALFRAHSGVVGAGPPSGGSHSSSGVPTPSHGEEVKLRVSSGYTHASIDPTQNIVSARDNYPSVVAEVLLFKGLWLYEVEILQLGFDEGEKPSNRRRPRGLQGAHGADDEAEAYVGWADKRFFGDYVRGQGVGDCRHSWGWRVSKKSPPTAKHAGSVLPAQGQKMAVKDILTLSVSIQTGRACFFVNGELRGSFDDVTPAVGLMPAISVWPGARLKVNFGPRLVHMATLTSSAHSMCIPPPLVDGYRPVAEWANWHKPPKLPERIPTPTLHRSLSAGTRSLDLSGPAVRQVSSPAVSSAQPREASSSRSELCLQQLRISAQLALGDGVADDDAELQGLLQQLLEHTSRRLGTSS